MPELRFHFKNLVRLPTLEITLFLVFSDLVFCQTLDSAGYILPHKEIGQQSLYIDECSVSNTAESIYGFLIHRRI